MCVPIANVRANKRARSSDETLFTLWPQNVFHPIEYVERYYIYVAVVFSTTSPPPSLSLSALAFLVRVCCIVEDGVFLAIVENIHVSQCRADSK